MITFYPRDVGMWRTTFDFNLPITLTPKERTPRKNFATRVELIEFLKAHGVRLDDPRYPLEFREADHHAFGRHFAIIQWTLIGWCIESDVHWRK